MADPLVPYGYQGALLTWGQMEKMTTWHKLDWEFRRRFRAMSIAAAHEGVRLGIGTGWRVQPNPPPAGFADPGNSNHEGFPADGVHGQAVAIDTVPESGWDWMEARCSKYGLRTFRDVNDEPWHCQPSDIPAGRDWRTEPWDLATWPLPDQPPKPRPPLGRIRVELNKTVLRPKQRARLRGNGDVFLVQYLADGMYRQSGNEKLNIGKPDGDYGPKTVTAVKVMQALNNLKADGVTGRLSWRRFLNADGK